VEEEKAQGIETADLHAFSSRCMFLLHNANNSDGVELQKYLNVRVLSMCSAQSSYIRILLLNCTKSQWAVVDML
jgi:hypothetical protein